MLQEFTKYPRGRAFVTAIALWLMVALHAVALIQSGERKVFTNSITPLPVEAASSMQALQPAHLVEMMEIEIPLRMKSYPALVEKIAREKNIQQAVLDRDFLPSVNDYEKVKKWLVSEGFVITKTDPNRLAVFAKGTLAQIQKSLAVEMVNVTVKGKSYHAAHTHPSLPLEIADPVLGINGLQPYLQMRKRSPSTSYAVPYSVSDVLTAYNAKNLGVTGSGQKIAILIDTIPFHSDLTAFWTNNGIPQSLSNIEEINVNNVAASVLATPTGEETLDVEWSSGIAPGAKVRVYAVGSLDYTSLDKGLLEIISDLPTQPQMHQLSMSLGLGEADLVASSQIQTDSQYLAMIAAGGVSVFASSGDSGSNSDGDSVVQVEYYASDPSVTGVGGTSLTMNSSGTVTSETVWNNNKGASGGGISQVFTRPSWQKGTGVPTGTMRCVPDVALMGDPNTGGYIYFTGTYSDGTAGGGAGSIGGTSLSSPAWAALCALINQARANAGLPPIGLLNPNIYPLIGTNNFRDITSGNNGSYTAGGGYDECTGIGVPSMSHLLQTLSSTTPGAPSITAFSPVSGTAGTSVSISGLNFDNVTALKFNGVSAPFVVNASTQITCTVPSGASLGPISVLTAAGSGTSTANFAVTTGSATPLFSSGFESSQGYTMGTLAGQNGWVKAGSGGNAVTVDGTDAVFSGDGNQASIGYTAPTSGTTESIGPSINYTPSASEIINFSVLADFVDSTGDTPHYTAPRDRFRWSVYNSAGTRLFSIEFDNSNDNINYLLDDNVTHLIGNLMADNTLYSIQFTVDFTRNVWTATLNGSALVSNLPVATGTETLNLGSIRAEWVLNSTKAGNNYMLFDNYSITKSQEVPNVSTWKSSYFTLSQLADPNISGDLANPSGDGICNLLDYAFDLSPLVHQSRSVLPQVALVGGCLTLTYTCDNTATDLIYTVEVSSDLQTWNSGPGYTSTPTTLNNNGFTQTVQVSDLTPVSSGNKRFIRLRITVQ